MTNRQLFQSFVAPTSEAPLGFEVARAEACYLYDEAGKAHLDLISGISVANIGHRHPKVVAAIKAQADAYLHTMVYGEHIQSPQVQLAQLLVRLLPANLNSVYFTNSGSEATEGAMKLAKRVTGRTEFVSFEKSYHGSTQGALSLMGGEYFKQAFRPLLPDTRHIRFNNLEDLQQITAATAAVFCETIKAEAGVQVIDANYFKALRERCSEVGALLVLDEIQTGLGRSGKLFSFEHWNIVPDILLLGKALGAGLPLAAFIADKNLMQQLSYQPVLGHITTFGGNPLCCAASKAGIEVLLENKHWMDVCQRETLLRKGLVHPKIKAIRSFGFLMAMELDSFDTCVKLMHAAMAKGVLVDWFLFAENCIRIAPPLCITEEELQYAITVLISCLDEC
jgi:acetylornithine/succinyldiaminopimelate/putrescine aminotransferase